MAVLEQRIDADLAVGRHAELVGELEALIVRNPLRERLRFNSYSPSTARRARPRPSTPTVRLGASSQRSSGSSRARIEASRAGNPAS